MKFNGNTVLIYFCIFLSEVILQKEKKENEIDGINVVPTSSSIDHRYNNKFISFLIFISLKNHFLSISKSQQVIDIQNIYQ